VAAAFGTFGIVLAAWYLLTAVRKLLYGPFNPANETLRDMNAREIIIAVSLVVFFFIIGLAPNIFFDKINPATAELYSRLDAVTAVAGR
jgi:NADH-quinone oxidoreductase subunit M